MTIDTIELTQGRLTRVGYLEVPVPPALLGLTDETIAAVSWSPAWADGTQPRLGAAAWIAEVAGRRLVFDPLLALDVVLRPDPDTERASEEAVTRLFAEAGFPVESIDLVVMSHIDGIGMVARRDQQGGWTPFFPRARILLSELELSGFVASASSAEGGRPEPVRDAWTALIDGGRVDSYADGEAIVPGLMADVSGGHGPGHAVMHFMNNGRPEASLIGHLAVSPIHLATGECAALNEDPAAAWRLLHENARDGRLISGSLWPAPGFGRWAEERLEAGV